MVTPAASYDVVIIGGGVMGCAIAYFLAASDEFDGAVAVIERDPGYAECATVLSWGGIRQQFSTPENVRMSLYGAAFLKRAPELLAIDGDRPDFGFREQGYLFLASEAGKAAITRNVAMQTGLGAKVVLLGARDLAARFPWLGLEGVVAGALGLSNEGWFDPERLLRALRRKAVALGAHFFQDEALGIVRDGGRVTGVRLAGGDDIGCGVLVNAAGPRAAAIAAMVGCDLPVRPRKRTTFVFECRDGPLDAPLTVAPSGVAFRPEGGRFIAIMPPPDDADSQADDLVPDHALFEPLVWPALARLVPAFSALRQTSAWAGHYDFNVFDHNAVIGPHPEIAGFLFCNGFSGHGVQHAPAAGRAVAELIIHGEFRTLDASAFSYARIAAGRSLNEANVV